ncbi:hypothetical protein ACGFZL_03920 [Streptomyces sp. NPDC048182]|uniref:hypothetical protein n=1 Tax=Streptomyces sp. NPDC048182 TaxID=3365507 RepID=UPI003712554C
MSEGRDPRPGPEPTEAVVPTEPVGPAEPGAPTEPAQKHTQAGNGPVNDAPTAHGAPEPTAHGGMEPTRPEPDAAGVEESTGREPLAPGGEGPSGPDSVAPGDRMPTGPASVAPGGSEPTAHGEPEPTRPDAVGGEEPSGPEPLALGGEVPTDPESLAPGGEEPSGPDSVAPGGRGSTGPASVAPGGSAPTAHGEPEPTRPESDALGGEEPTDPESPAHADLESTRPEPVVPGERKPSGPEPDAPGELDLGALLREAVRDVEPADGTLEHLRRAVPARRARKRQAVVGMAAAALFIGTAVPALVHVSQSGGPGANPSVAGNASEAQGGTSQGQGKDRGAGPSGAAGTATAGPSASADPADPGKKPEERRHTAPKPGAPPGVGGPSASTLAEPTACTPAQLGPAFSNSAAPDSTGAVYGTFRVANVSSSDCVVTGPGSVVVTPVGAADPARIGSARHTAGDAAAGLPDPSLESAALTVKSGGAYEVRFAWVPSEPCPTPGGGTGDPTGEPTPPPTPTEDTTGTGGTDLGGTEGEAGPTTQLMTEHGPVDGGVSVSYTPSTGTGGTTTSVPNACAGTVYWTGILTVA